MAEVNNGFDEQIVDEDQVAQPDHEEAVPGKRKRSSWVWKHFDIEVKKTDTGVLKIGTCKYCKTTKYNAAGRVGTSNYSRHLDSCVEYKKIKSGEDGGREIDQNLYRRLIAEAIMRHGYSFSWVEHEGNRKIHKFLNNKAKPISRNTAKRVCIQIHGDLKQKIRNTLNGLPGKICLTSDLWTACTSRAYMCITAHYITENWELHSKLLCFQRCPTPHGGLELSQHVTNVILDWEISAKIFSLTVDNATNMDKMVSYLKQGVFKDLVCSGEHFHIRCCAHILNLIVKSGLEKINSCVHKVREGVRYSDGSETRMNNFYDCAKKFKLPFAFKLWMDVPTRWNSTYIMLYRALKYRDVLDNYFAGIDGSKVLDMNEWRKVENICGLLEPFNDITNLFSGSDYPTASLYFPNVWKIHLRLKQALNSSDDDVKSAAKDMLEKFEKYWTDYVRVLALGVIFDPRYKMEFVEYALIKLNGYSEGIRLTGEVKVKFDKLYSEYEGLHGATRSSNERDIEPAGVEDDFAEFMEFDELNLLRTESDVYLKEDRKDFKSKVDVLAYWKENYVRFPILSSMARDVLAIPITTVASESTFSMGGRILNKWRSSLSSRNVDTLVTCKQWLTGYDDYTEEGANVSFDSDDEVDIDG